MAIDLEQQSEVLDDLYASNPDAAVNRTGDAAADAALDKLRALTNPLNKSVGRPPMYNARDRWYAREDGHIVKLQGDAASQAYYTSKGFHLLTPQEEHEWLTKVRPLVIREQRTRANLITTLRRIAEKHPGIDLSGDLDITPTDELRQMLDQVKGMAGDNVRVIMGRHREDPSERDMEASGVVLASGAELEAKITRAAAQRQVARGSGKQVEFTGDGSAV